MSSSMPSRFAVAFVSARMASTSASERSGAWWKSASWRAPASWQIRSASDGPRVAEVRDALVVLGREHRVVDHEVGALAQAHDALAHARELLHVGGGQLGARAGRLRDELVLEQDVGERRRVGDVDDARAVDGRGGRPSRCTGG